MRQTGVIDLENGDVDLASGDFAQLLRSPDLRLVGLTWECQHFDSAFHLDYPDPRRACFYHVLQGAAFFRTGPGDDDVHYITEGTTVGVEGHAHHWSDASHVHPSISRRLRANRGTEDFPLRLVVSSIDRSAAVLQRLPQGTIIIPVSARPYSQMIEDCVQLVERDRASAYPDPGVQRRLAEIIMLQLVGFARSRLWSGLSLSSGVQYDEFLLRAMTAFFAAPGKQWTVEKLAKEAGLSRAAFADRFSRAFGTSPLRTLNKLRLQQSAEMLVRSNASLGDIAQEIGFGSAAAFLRAFKKQFSITPGEWRQRHREEELLG